MRKGWKTFWIVCACIAALGIAFCIAGAVMGATTKGVLSVLQSANLASIHDVEVTTEETREVVEAEPEAGEEVVSQSMEYEDIRSLDVDIVCPNLVIEEYSGSQIQVKTERIPENIQNDMSFYVDKDELKIKLDNKKKWKNLFGDLKGTLTIRIPEDYDLEEASLTVDAGELQIENIRAEELKIDIGAGRAVVKQFTADKIDVECGAGEANIAGTAEKEIQIECGVGSVTYRASGRQQDYDYELSCGIGDLNVGNDSFGGISGKQKIDNGGHTKMEIECGIGEVNVTFGEEL